MSRNVAEEDPDTTYINEQNLSSCTPAKFTTERN